MHLPFLPILPYLAAVFSPSQRHPLHSAEVRAHYMLAQADAGDRFLTAKPEAGAVAELVP